MARASAMLLASSRTAAAAGATAGWRGRLLVHLVVAGVTAEQPRRRELAELVAHHVLRHVHGDELVPVVHGEGVAHELRQHRARARPGLHDLLLVAGVQCGHLLRQGVLHERALLYASRHSRVPGYCVALPRFRPRTIRRSDAFFLLRVLTPSFLPHGLTTFRPPRVRPPCG